MKKKKSGDWKKLVVVAENQADPLGTPLLDRVFNSVAFISFLNIHSINFSKKDKHNIRLQQVCNKTHIASEYSDDDDDTPHHNNITDIKNDNDNNKKANELCAVSASTIPGGTVVLPYTGVFMNVNIDTASYFDHTNTISNNRSVSASYNNYCSLMPDTLDRDMSVEWKRFDGATGRMLGQYESKIRGWDIRIWEKPTKFIKRRGQWASFLNHRCLDPTCEFVVVDVYVFLSSKQCDAPWLVFSSTTKKEDKQNVGKILGDGTLVKQHRKVPPMIPLQFEGEVLLFGWPVVETLRPIAKNEELTVNYGSGFVAISPFHCKNDNDEIIITNESSSLQQLDFMAHWKSAKKNKGAYCECADCLALSDPKKRSLFLEED